MMQGFNPALWLVGGVIGSITFWLFQVMMGSSTITRFMGRQIVAQGGYARGLEVFIGWGVHLAVSLGYALVFALFMRIPFSRSRGKPVVIGLVAALALGWAATLLTEPAIVATISVLSWRGWPPSLPGFNTTLGPPLWNHMLFFTVVWLIYVLIPYLGRKY